MKFWGLAAVVTIVWAGSANATIIKFQWTGTVQSIQIIGNKLDPINVGDTISISYIYDDNSRGLANILASPGGGTDAQYNVILTDLSFQAGSYLYTSASQAAILSYRNDSFGQDFINFLYHTGSNATPQSIFSNPQLIAQGPSSILATADASEGFPYSSFPTVRTVFGSADLAGDNNLIFGNLSVSLTYVPEPTLWAMFVGGFGLMGAAMRRMKTAVSFAWSAQPFNRVEDRVPPRLTLRPRPAKEPSLRSLANPRAFVRILRHFGCPS